MDPRENLILVKGKNRTANICSCEYDLDNNKYVITFQSGTTYSYGCQSIEWITKPEVLSPASVHIYHGERKLFNIKDIRVFHAPAASYWHICFSDGRERTYDRKALKVITSCLGKEKARACLDYLRKLAAINELKSDDGEVLLQKQYEKLDFIGDDTAMAIYLDPEEHKPCRYQAGDLIFPFGGNASQFKAVEAALTNQVSVIQGPPGTGKTQTILNIIANLLVEGKTVQVVSNNNSATANVLEKLASPKYNMDFFVASLGNAANKKLFVQKQTGQYPELAPWEMEADKQAELHRRIKALAAEVSETFTKRERLAQAKQELDSLLLEIKYFEQYYLESGLITSTALPKRTLKSDNLLKLWLECEAFSEKQRSISFWFKIKSAFIYGISDWGFYKNSLASVITYLQSLFYRAREAELIGEIEALERYIASVNADGKMDELIGLSMDYLRAKLFDRYGKTAEREVFTDVDIWKRAETITKEYPVILSTTFSSRSCLQGAVYDYIIMDEASQVDISTGALALSSARNAVIVGDLKQLPNVVTGDVKRLSRAVFQSYTLHQGYSYSENSFLKSICSILPEVSQTLLREHYRCHPKIIGFCNQKFYNNELVVMTEDNGEPDALSAIRTVVGKHRRDHINQRQIDVTVKEALPMFVNDSPEDIGIIAPYKNQVSEIAKHLGTDKIEVHTVHKFQGREKNTIILTTVDDVVTDFSDDPYLLNVAVSRAKNRLCLIASGNEQPSDSNIGDLIDYIEYNNFSVIDSEIYSVFDLLYQQYTKSRIAFLKKHRRVSEYDSENLMYATIAELLKKRPKLPLKIICRQPLNMLIRDRKRLSGEERKYAMNPATHLDFLIYNQISKKSVLAIEVDGFHYHKQGTPQYERDRMKDHILQLYDIPLLRFPTTGSGEADIIGQALDDYARG